MTTERIDVSRRENLNALLAVVGGAVGLTALTGCTGRAAAAGEQTATVLSALTGSSIAYVPNVLGAPPTSSRSGALATNDASAIGANIVIAGGCIVPGDGGGGLFYWNTSGAVDDGGLNIVPGASGGAAPCWTRLCPDSASALSVRWFGAVGDGVSDDSLAIQNAVNAPSVNPPAAGPAPVPTLVFPNGVYLIATNLTVPGPVQFEPGAAVLVASGNTLAIQGSVGAAPSQYIFQGAPGGTVSLTAEEIVHATWFGAGVIPDLGIAINAADAALNTNPGRIEVNCNGGQINSAVFISSRHVLHLGSGSYTSTVTSTNGNPLAATFVMHDYTEIYGDGRNTIIQESSGFIAPGISATVIIAPYAWAAIYNNNAGNYGHLVVRDLSTTYNPNNAQDGSGFGHIEMGNATDVLVQNVHIFGSNANGIDFGGDSSAVPPNSASYFTIRDCRISNVYGSSIAVVNGHDFVISGNTFDGDPLIGASTLAYIDCEVNASTDVMYGFVITDNDGGRPDTNKGVPLGIQVAGALGEGGNNPYGYGVVANNRINGLVTIGYNFIHVENVLISGNHLVGAAQAGMGLNGCRNCTVQGNSINVVPQGILLTNCSYTRVLGNTVTDDGHGNDEANVIESGTVCDHNVIVGNVIEGTNLPGVFLVGPNSKAANWINGVWSVRHLGKSFGRRVCTGAPGTTSLTTTDELVEMNASGGSFVFSLLDATACANQSFVLVHSSADTSGNAVTLATVGNQTINNTTSGSLFTLSPGMPLRIYSDGANFQTC